MRKDGKMFMSCCAPFVVEQSYKKGCDILISYAYKSAYETFFKLVKENGHKPLFMMDSGAYTNTSGTAGSTDDKMEEYIKFVNDHDEYIDYFVQMDKIPRTESNRTLDLRNVKEVTDYNMQNYLYFLSKVKSPEKVVPVYHSGESFEFLDWLLDFEPQIDLIGLGLVRDDMDNVMSYLKEKGVLEKRKFHILGAGSAKVLRKVNVWSSDASSFVRKAAYKKIPMDLVKVIEVGERRNPELFLDERQREQLSNFIHRISNVEVEDVLNDYHARLDLWLDYYKSKEFRDFVFVGDIGNKRKNLFQF